MIITFEQLQQSTGYNKPAEVANLLTRNNIKYLRGKNGRPAEPASVDHRADPWPTLARPDAERGRAGRAAREQSPACRHWPHIARASLLLTR